MGIIFSSINLFITLAVVGLILGALIFADCKWTKYICKNNQITVPTSFPTNFPSIPFSRETDEDKRKRMMMRGSRIRG